MNSYLPMLRQKTLGATGCILPSGRSTVGTHTETEHKAMCLETNLVKIEAHH
jgi:hypothetical protein